MNIPRPIRVLTIDSLPLVHAGVRQLLSAFPDIELVGEVFTAGDVLHHRAPDRCEIALVEIDDLGPDWSATLAQLVDGLPAARVVVFTLSARPEQVRQALRAGAQGYLLKNVQPLTLAQALRSIVAGQQVFAPEATRALMLAQPDAPALSETLSQREREVLALLARGLSNQAIGARLCVSRATVKFHCRNVFAKLGVESRAQAVATAYTYNLVPRLVTVSDQTDRSICLVEHKPVSRSA